MAADKDSVSSKIAQVDRLMGEFDDVVMKWAMSHNLEAEQVVYALMRFAQSKILMTDIGNELTPDQFETRTQQFDDYFGTLLIDARRIFARSVRSTRKE